MKYISTFNKASILLIAAIVAGFMGYAVVYHAAVGHYCYAFFLAFPTYYAFKGLRWLFSNINEL